MQQKRRQIMQTAINFVKIYPLTTLLVIFIWVICVIPIPETPLSNVTFADKWTHLVMYFSLSMCVAHEYFRKHKKIGKKPLLLYIWLLPVVMGRLVEIVQATCTNGVRNGDWLDFVANGSGSTLALPVCVLLATFRSKG